ncbi:hypothetical protein D3C72_468120 [compost metagenome]
MGLWSQFQCWPPGTEAEIHVIAAAKRREGPDRPGPPLIHLPIPLAGLLVVASRKLLAYEHERCCPRRSLHSEMKVHVQLYARFGPDGLGSIRAVNYCLLWFSQ